MQILLALLLFFSPEAVDTQICPVDDKKCVKEVDALFSDPSSNAGLAVAVICGVQVAALGTLFCFRSNTYRRQVQQQIDRAVAVALNGRSQVASQSLKINPARDVLCWSLKARRRAAA